MNRSLLAAAIALPLAAHAADHAILGNQFTIKNPGAAVKRRIKIKAQEPQSPDAIVGNPVANGATIEITTTGGSGGTESFPLSAGLNQSGKPFWTGDLTKGFKYRDGHGENGPVKSAALRRAGSTFQISVDVDGKLGTVSLVPPNPGASGCLLLTVGGGDSYSVQFATGKVSNSGSTLFKITRPTAQGSCLPPVALIPPLNFEAATPLQANGADLTVSGRVVPRLIDWEDNGVADLLLFGGDGFIRLALGAGAATSTSFQLPMPVKTTDGANLKVGSGATGGAFVDLNGDHKRDLVIAGEDNRIRLFANSGTSTPAFSPTPTFLENGAGDFLLPALTYSRIDVADWDGDGLPDVLAGHFDSGRITFYRNTGTATAPSFNDPGILLSIAGTPIGEAYNTHPRVIDFTGDGVRDLVYGINWHYFRLCPADPATPNDFPACPIATDQNGAEINLSATSGGDSCPDFGDLNGDGVADMIDGGNNGRVVVLFGRPYTTALAQITSIMAAHPADLGPTMQNDQTLRSRLFDLHRAVRTFFTLMRPGLATRTAIRDWYVAHITTFSNYLRWHQVDKNVEQFVPSLGGQTWINLFESMPDTPAHRALTASTAQFTGVQSQLLTDRGMIFIENHQASLAQRQVLYDIQSSLPLPYQVVEAVTIADFIIPTGATNVPGLAARTGVNLFSSEIGDYAEGFPPDVTQALVDGYSVVVAHELNHNVEAPATKLFPSWYRQRKSELLKLAAPAGYRWSTNADGSYSWDVTATKAALQSSGDWDGVEAHWQTALTAYWNTGAGAGYDQHWCRDNLKFSIENPQEAFATLSNQYFDSSETMLQLGLNRFNSGNPYCLNQVLFFAEVYATGGSTVPFYRVDTLGHVQRTDLQIWRGPGGHINGVKLANGTEYHFTIAANGDVISIP